MQDSRTKASEKRKTERLAYARKNHEKSKTGNWQDLIMVQHVFISYHLYILLLIYFAVFQNNSKELQEEYEPSEWKWQRDNYSGRSHDSESEDDYDQRDIRRGIYERETSRCREHGRGGNRFERSCRNKCSHSKSSNRRKSFVYDESSDEQSHSRGRSRNKSKGRKSFDSESFDSEESDRDRYERSRGGHRSLIKKSRSTGNSDVEKGNNTSGLESTKHQKNGESTDESARDEMAEIGVGGNILYV